MLIEETDRVEIMIFTLPVREAIWKMPPGIDLSALTQAEFMGQIFDDYIDKIGHDLQVRRITYPERIDVRGTTAWHELGIMRRDGWELWQARYTVLTLTEGS